MKRSVAFFLLCLILISLLAFFLLEEFKGKKTHMLEVVFFDVGQGDSIFIESPQGTQVLIDGGRDATVLRRLGESMGPLDRTIDVVLATHPDADHISGLIEVLRRYTVRTIITTDNVSDTPVYAAFKKAVAEEGAKLVTPRRGDVFDLGKGEAGSTTLTILFPDRSVRDLESNMSSIVAKLSYGSADVLFTGDSPQAIEEYLVSEDGAALESEVLKVGHHGSRTSTAATFVAAVAPLFGIISAGKDNDYGHPHKETLDTLAAYGVKTKSTADLGSIILMTDGRTISLKESQF